MRLLGTLMPNGPNRKAPAPRSSSAPNTLGESKRGAQSQSTVPSGATSAPVWQFERNAYCAIGVNGDGAAALCGSAAGRPFGLAAAGCALAAPSAFAAPSGVRLFLAVVLMSSPSRVDANVRGRPGCDRRPPGPNCPSHMGAPAADGRAAAASPASTPRHRPGA